MKQVLCRCRSRCTRYDPSTGSYVGSGVLISYKTARRHILDDERREALGYFVRPPDPQTLDPPTPLDNTRAFGVEGPSPEELSALEVEITGRTVWLPMDHTLVFLNDPGPSQEFTLPHPSDIHLSNHGPHALDATLLTNTAFIENEMRLCEILVRLRELRHSGTPLENLEERVSEGLARLWSHKEVEWRRRRYCSLAIHHGFSVVETGMFSFSA